MLITEYRIRCARVVGEGEVILYASEPIKFRKNETGRMFAVLKKDGILKIVPVEYILEIGAI